MHRNREAFIRYRIINRCLAENGRAGIEEILNSCRNALGKPVERKTIEQDLEDMKSDPELGYLAPIEYDPKEQKYFYRDPSYSMDSIPLNKEEKENLTFAANLLSQFRFGKLFGNLQGVIQKIVDRVIIDNQEQGPKYDFIDFEKTPHIRGSEFLLPLIEAIRNQKVLEIYYQPFYEEKPNFVHIHPYLLKEYHYRWYLIGLNDNKKELRTYALDRFIEIREINLPFIPKDFNAAEYFKNTVGVISPTGKPPLVKIEVLKPQANYLLTQPLHVSQYVDSEDEDKIVFAYQLHPTYEFQSMILGMGSDVKVLEPKRLAEKIKDQLKEALSKYS